jgi:hypothetical protein
MFLLPRRFLLSSVVRRRPEPDEGASRRLRRWPTATPGPNPAESRRSPQLSGIALPLDLPVEQRETAGVKSRRPLQSSLDGSSQQMPQPIEKLADDAPKGRALSRQAPGAILDATARAMIFGVNEWQP